jgi:hypothetical protein
MEIGKHDFDHDKCSEMARHMMHLSSLPAECMKYKDITSDLKRRDTDTTHPTQVLSWVFCTTLLDASIEFVSCCADLKTKIICIDSVKRS